METSSMDFFDLAGHDPEIRFSPYCWKTRMALAHKGIVPTTIPWRYSDKPKIAFTDQGSVPVIRHGAVGVSDSWRIALYLEEAFPDRPSLFGGGASIPLCHFINCWADAVLMPAVARIVMRDVHDLLMVVDQPYFRSTREQRFGMTLEELVAGPAGEGASVSEGPGRGEALVREAAVPRRRGADVCRLLCLRRIHVGALLQRRGVAGAR